MFNFSAFDNYADDQKRAFAQLEADDKDAKAKNVLVGRLISVPACDGYAHYVVEEADDKQVFLKHITLWDAYRDRTIEAMNRVLPLAVAQNLMRTR
ncbi:MAG: hypothetical protein EOP83_02075 [Verrucomicrobiaceae bacterium]|nr:MAG: hypothetical protein EOP83_02075 [Verrucomicrobiaceae bacterium]